MVAGDEHAAAQQAEVAVGVAGRGHDLPAVDTVAVAQPDRLAGEPDQRTDGRGLLVHLVGEVVGDAVAAEPGRDPRRPVVAPPHALALRVVELALVHGRPGRCRRCRRAAHVVGMEVRDDDAGHVQAGQRVAEPRERETGVDERPPVVPATAGSSARVPGRAAAAA